MPYFSGFGEGNQMIFSKMERIGKIMSFMGKGNGCQLPRKPSRGLNIFFFKTKIYRTMYIVHLE